jgi:DNA-binding IclR family transcriptional regulator
MPENHRSLVQSVSRSLRILEALGRSEKPQSLAEITAAVELPKTTVHRLLETLHYEGYVEQDPVTRQLFLSSKIMDLAASFLGRLDIREVARPLLIELWQHSQETVHLGLLDNREVLYVEKLESPHTIRMYSEIGRRAPLYCTGLGKVLLAHLPADEIELIVGQKQLRRYTENTLVDRAELFEEMAVIRSRGAAFDNEEHEKSVRCVAAPVYDVRQQVIAAISIAGPAFRMTPERQKDLEPHVVKAAQKISQRLGYNTGLVSR